MRFRNANPLIPDGRRDFLFCAGEIDGKRDYSNVQRAGTAADL